MAGEPAPWSGDPIFQRYHFCNVYRELDRGTVWLRENWRSEEASPENLIFNICLYRHFNWIPTAEAFGFTTAWNKQRAIDRLKEIQAFNGRVFTTAHIVRGRNGWNKIDSVCETLDWIWQARYDLVDSALETNSLQATFQKFLEFDYIGPFLAYEFVTDLRHTPVLHNANDINTWANAGPGAKRGLRHIWPGLRADGELPYMQWLRKTLEEEGLTNVEMREVEHSLCELDKYVRILNGEYGGRKFAKGLGK